jgi:hypothetical protein
MSPDDFEYALENTRVLVPPRARLETFGTTHLHYVLLTEDMDTVNLTRIREGSIRAERPQIISPHTMAKLLLEGFEEKAQQYAEWLSSHAQQLTFLKYGFRISKQEITTYEVSEAFESVAERISSEVRSGGDPLRAVVAGVDTGWEIGLLKCMVETIQASAPENLGDLRRRGLLS